MRLHPYPGKTGEWWIADWDQPRGQAPTIVSDITYITKEACEDAIRDLREASLGQRLGFQPLNSRTHGYNGQEHR